MFKTTPRLKRRKERKSDKAVIWLTNPKRMFVYKCFYRSMECMTFIDEINDTFNNISVLKSINEFCFKLVNHMITKRKK